MFRELRNRKIDTEVVMRPNESVDGKLETQEQTFRDRILEFIPAWCLPLPEPDLVDVDEVDGLTEDVLKPIVKLVFLKILLVDIGISLGDVVTDLLQGLSLVFDGDWNIQWSTYHYGLGVLGVMWLPGLVTLLHQASGEATYKIFPKSNKNIRDV